MTSTNELSAPRTPPDLSPTEIDQILELGRRRKVRSALVVTSAGVVLVVFVLAIGFLRADSDPQTHVATTPTERTASNDPATLLQIGQCSRSFLHHRRRQTLTPLHPVA